MNFLNKIVTFGLCIGLAFGENSFLECKAQSECIAPEATCVENICRCPQGKVLSTVLGMCLEVATAFGQVCEEDIQCGYLLGRYRCNNKKCDCQEGWIYFDGWCRLHKKLGEACTTRGDCFNGYNLHSIDCISGVCTCNEGYYERANIDCRPSAGEGEFCSLDIDCQVDGNTCQAQKCKPATSAKMERKLLNKTTINKMIIKENEPLEVFTSKAACESDAQCSDAHTICSPLTKQCICQRGYFADSTKGCIAELGVQSGCKIPADCGSSSKFRCEEGVCYCTSQFAYNTKDNRDCKKITSTDVSCSFEESCHMFGEKAQCVSVNGKKKCVCLPGYALTPDFVCSTTICSSDLDCSHFANTICPSATGRCECKEHYHALGDGKCVPSIGGECDGVNACTTANSTCNAETHVCECDADNDFVPEGELICKRKAPLGNDCSANEDCVTPFSECLGGICVCANDYLESNKTCDKKMYFGSYCGTAKQCHKTLGKMVECRKSQCLCPMNYEVAEDKVNCKPSGALKIEPVTTVLFAVVSLLLVRNRAVSY